MNKKLIALAIFGVLLMITGGVGSAYYYSLVDKDLRVVTTETFKVKDEKNNKTLNLTVQGNIHYSIYSSNDDNFHLESEVYSKKADHEIIWEPQETTGATDLNVSFKRKNQKKSNFNFGIDFWEGRYEYINISIPKSYQAINLISSDGSGHKYINLNDLNTQNLTINSHNSNLSLRQIKTETLTATGQKSSFDLYNVKAEKSLEITNKNGYVFVNESRSPKINLTTDSGDISLFDIVGATTLSTKDGDITIDAVAGETIAKNDDGNIYWDQAKLKGNTELETVNGDIYVYLIQAKNQLNVTAHSKTGDVSIFNKDQESVKGSATGLSLDLKSVYGDIEVASEDDYYDD